MTLKQYHHLRKEDVNTLLEYWFERQAAGKLPLRFRKSARKSASEEENGSNADMGLPEEAEERLHGNDDSHAQVNGMLQAGSGSNCSAEQANSGQSLGNAAENPRVSLLLKDGGVWY